MTAWIATFLICLLFPVLMIALGVFFKRGGPKQINHLYGYRTHWSMLSEDTWHFAHRYSGRISLVCGCVCLPLSVVAALCLLNQRSAILGTASAIILLVQVLTFVFATVLPTECALRRTFDNKGNRK